MRDLTGMNDRPVHHAASTFQCSLNGRQKGTFSPCSVGKGETRYFLFYSMDSSRGIDSNLLCFTIVSGLLTNNIILVLVIYENKFSWDQIESFKSIHLKFLSYFVNHSNNYSIGKFGKCFPQSNKSPYF